MVDSRNKSGNLVLHPSDLSEPEFVSWASFMESVNTLIPRNFGYHSRRCFRELRLAEEHRNSLPSLLFEGDGKLSKSIRKDVNTDGALAITIGGHMEDKRWQLELVPGEGACTWNLIRDVLVEAQVLNAESEDIRSISLVIGGTEDQLIHHDVSRDFVCWSDTELDEEKESNFRRVQVGWEHNRIAYNEAMSNTYAPSSILIPMGKEKDGCLLGIQKREQISHDALRGKCSILKGDGTQYRIQRENPDLVVIRVGPGGCQFTGDFCHAGVRNCSYGLTLDKTLSTINEKFTNYTTKTSTYKSRISKAISLLSDTANVQELCRLHVSTKMINEYLHVPENQVGLYGCSQNKRDTRYES